MANQAASPDPRSSGQESSDVIFEPHMKKSNYLIFILFFLLTGCATYLKLSDVDKIIEDSLDESVSIAALVISYHQIQGVWPSSSDQLNIYFSNANIDSTMSKNQKAIDDCLYYLNEIKSIEFYSSSYDNLSLTYKNYKNRDVWINLSTKNSTQNEDNKSYLLSARIIFPSNAKAAKRETATSENYLSKKQNNFLIKTIGYIIEGLQYVPPSIYLNKR